MISGKYSGLVTCVAAAGLGAFVSLWLLDFAVVRVGFCGAPPTETISQCAREWIGALSGWAAAVAAGITLALTLGPLREQVRQARRQTDFAVGEALPTFDAIEHVEKSNTLVCRIVNWNRSAIVVRIVETVEKSESLVIIDKLAIDDTPQSLDKITFKIKPFVINGWENRSERPHYAEVRFIAFDSRDDLKISQRSSWSNVERVVAEVQILGAKHRKITLEADTGVLR